MARNYAPLMHDYLEEMEDLSDAEFGRLCRALLQYSMTGEAMKLSGGEKYCFGRVKAQEDRAQKSYLETSQKRSDAGKSGADKRWHNIANDSKAMASHNKNGQSKSNTNTNTNTNTNISYGDNIPPISPKGDWGDVSPELKTALDEFTEMRKKIKKPLTDRAKGMLIAQLDKLAGDDTTKCAILAQSVFHCWQGVFPIKNDDIGADTKNPYTKLLNEMQNGGDPF